MRQEDEAVRLEDGEVDVVERSRWVDAGDDRGAWCEVAGRLVEDGVGDDDEVLGQTTGAVHGVAQVSGPMRPSTCRPFSSWNVRATRWVWVP